MKNISSWQKELLWVSLFGIAMGFLESAVVVYLRTIYYPHGFGFPLAPFDQRIAIIELGREGATIIMLLSIGYISGKSLARRFAYFIYIFAIWDIFYYLFLKVLIDWPKSFMTWDVLFLIPIPWTGPVITPMIISLTMVILAMLIMITEEKGRKIEISLIAWMAFIIGSMTLILAFIWDFSGYVLKKYTLSELLSLSNNDALYKTTLSYLPCSFNWFIFILGEIVIVTGIYLVALRSRKNKKDY
jgi:hypothetical protein